MRTLSAAEELGVAGGDVVVPGRRDRFIDPLENYFVGRGAGEDGGGGGGSSFTDAGGGGVGGEDGGDAPPAVPSFETMKAWDVTEWTDFFAAFTKDWSKAQTAAFAAAIAALSQHPVCKVVGVSDYTKAMAIWIPTGASFWMASETRNELNEWPKDKANIFLNLVIEALSVGRDAGRAAGPRGR